MPLDVTGVMCSAYFREEANFIKVSLRSKGDYPVNLMAEKFFNGGGHKNAAGGEFLGSLQQAEQIFVKILPMFAKYLPKE
jgi:phosphoesterase RecJ-like protein